jgi:AcrR family transcriptional regulator
VTVKGTQRRAELLDAAEKILCESGYAALTLRAVASTAAVRLGHLQYYFPARADLVAAVLQRTLARSLERLAPLLTPAAAPEVLVRRLLSEQDDPDLVRMYAELWALAGRDEAVAAVMRGFYDDYRAHVAALIRTREPSLPDADCQARAGVFTMLIEGAALFRSGLAAHRSAGTDAELVAVAAGLLGTSS